MKWLAGGAGALTGGLLVLVVIPVVAVMALLSSQNCENATAVNVSSPAANVQTMGQMTSYLVSQKIPPVVAAGIVGNLNQESTLNPLEPGGGLAQWLGSRWAAMVSWVTSHGQDPSTIAGQLEYIAAQLTQGVDAGTFYSGTVADLNRAAQANSPQLAAILWMNDYEQCKGAGHPGTLTFTSGSPCDAPARETYALQAYQAAGGKHGGGSAMLVSLTRGGACNATYALTGKIKGYTNPFEKAHVVRWERTDMGVDAALTPGDPLLAFAPSTVIYIVPFYRGEPAVVFRITAGPLKGKDWYWSEQITPTVTQGQTVTAGETVATYAPAGSGIEIGWWDIGAGRPLGYPGYDDKTATHSGADFRFLLQALGANPGTGAGDSLGQTMGNTYYPVGNPGV